MPDAIAAVLWANLLLIAVQTFVRIQESLADPGRREFNERWYAQFENHVNECYAKNDIGWRVKDLEELWRG